MLELAIKHDIDLNHSCEGMGTCGTCMIIIESGLELMDSPGQIEQEMIESRGMEKNERLACQNCARAGLKIRIPGDE